MSKEIKFEGEKYSFLVDDNLVVTTRRRGDIVETNNPTALLARRYAELEAENERLREVAKAINSINRGRNHIVPESVTGDDEPCYWQRKEWIDWIVDLADKALRGEEV